MLCLPVGEWIQVDMGATRRITGVATQGSYTTGQWVTSYIVQYKVRTSDDFVAVQDIGGGREAKVSENGFKIEWL